MILSTKGTNNSYKTKGMIGALMMIGLGIVFLILYFFLSSKSSDNKLVAVFVLSMLSFFDGLIQLVKNNTFAKSYLEIYSDKISGKGIQQLNVVDFTLPIQKVQSITIEGFNINVNTLSGTYKIISDKETAEKVFKYYNTYMAGR